MVRPDGSVSNGSSSTQLGRALLSAPILTLRWCGLPVKSIMSICLYYKKHPHLEYLRDMHANDNVNQDNAIIFHF